jgi:hypothetical protein
VSGNEGALSRCSDVAGGEEGRREIDLSAIRFCL